MGRIPTSAWGRLCANVRPAGAIGRGLETGGAPMGPEPPDLLEDDFMTQWIPVAAQADLPEGQALAVEVAGEAVCLYNLGGTVYATQDTCTHEDASLAEGYIDGDCIECPLHQALFHIPTGEARTAPASVNLRVFPVRVVAGSIEVDAGSMSTAP